MEEENDKKDDKKQELRKEKISKFLKKNYLLILILIFAFILSLYLFNIAKNQTLWWDEAEYMSTATHWAFNVPYDINPQRPPLFQFLASLEFMAGLGELAIKFSLVTIPFLLLIIAIFYLGKEMFDKKIGLIAAFLASVSWTFLFWAVRVQPDFLSMLFQVLSIFFMWKYWKSPDKKLIILSGITAALAFYFKISALLIPIIFILFILLKERSAAFKNKDYYLFALTYIITLIPFGIWAFFTFGDPVIIFHSGYSDAIGTPKPFGWYNLDFFYSLTTPSLSFRQGGIDLISFIIYSPFFLLFILGVFLSSKFLLYFDIILKDKKRILDPNLFSVLALFIISAFYIFYIRGTEDRWVFLWMPFIFYLIAHSVIFIYDKLKKYNSFVALGIIILLLGIGAYWQIQHSIDLTNFKKESYMPIKQAGLWMKENSQKNDRILSISYTQTVYYTQRNVSSFSLLKNSSEFDKYLKENQPIKYLEISMFEPHPKWTNDWITANQNNLIPVQAYYQLDAQQNPQPVAVVYTFNQSYWNN